MGIQENKLKKLAENYHAGLCTPEELKKIRQWYDDFETNGYDLPPKAEIERASKEAALFVIAQVRAQQTDGTLEHGSSPEIVAASPFRKNTFRFTQYAAAAVFFLVVGIGTYYYLNPVKNSIVLAARKDISPGSNKAILTLSNGSRIALNNAKNGTLAQQGSTAVHKNGNGLLAYQVSTISSGPLHNDVATGDNTVATPRGGQYQVIMPDGSRAWLNSLSSIRFPVAFKGKERHVETTGEVYFEVAKDQSKPFRVTTAGQTVTVLGTHFNIMAYADEPRIITTLLEGSVRIAKAGQSETLKPGQQSLVDKDIRIKVADTDDAVAWKNGLTSFTDADLKTIMRKVSRWYDIDVEYQGQMADRTFTGAISRKSNLSALLKILALNHIQFSINDRKLIVKQ